MTRAEEIEQFMLAELANMGAEPTPENKLAFLTGLKQAWDEDVEEDSTARLEKTMYKVALGGMIFSVQAQLLLKI